MNINVKNLSMKNSVKLIIGLVMCSLSLHKWIDNGQNPIYPPHRGRKCVRCNKKQVTGNDGDRWDNVKYS